MTHGKDPGPQVFVERRSIVGGPFFGFKNSVYKKVEISKITLQGSRNCMKICMSRSESRC